MKKYIYLLTLTLIVFANNITAQELNEKSVLLVTIELENNEQKNNSSSNFVNAMVDKFWNGGSMMIDIMARDPNFMDDTKRYIKIAKDNNLEIMLLIKIDYSIDIKNNHSYMTKMEISYKIFSLVKNEFIREELIEDRSLNKMIRSELHRRNIFKNLGDELFEYINNPSNYPTKNIIRNSFDR